MYIVHVHIQVLPDQIDAFTRATLANARASLQEKGVIRFDVCQQTEDPARFTLVEIYREPADQLAHRETNHYATWRDTVASMMAAPRTSVKYVALHPAPSNG